MPKKNTFECNYVVQRKIRVDDIDDGEEFEDIDFVPSSWGLTDDEKEVYFKWLKDKDDHHFKHLKEDKSSQKDNKMSFLINAIKAEVPTTRSLRDIVLSTAKKLGITVAWLEQYFYDPESLLLGIKHDPKCPEFNPEETVEKAMDILVKKDIPGSCGVTANILHEILDPTFTGFSSISNNDLSYFINKIHEANKKSTEDRKHYYIHVPRRDHAFIIEVFNSKCRIYQSFIEEYSLAKDLSLNKQYPIGEFIELLKKAFSNINPPPHDTISARKELFNSDKIKSTQDFQLVMFTQDEKTKKNIEDKISEGIKRWSPFTEKKWSEI